MKTISQLQKEAKIAPKYVLTLNYKGVDCFISDTQTLTSVNLVSDVNKARQFSVGYDNEQIKLRGWGMTAKLAGITSPVTVKYL